MGRPASFDRHEVLGRATAVFWAHGYCDTSISQLVEATRLKPGSLYAAFESKEGLLHAALDHYAEQSVARQRALLDAAPDPLSGIRAVLEGLIDRDERTAGRGCFLVNTVLEVGPHNAAVQARVKAHLETVEEMLYETLWQAQAHGQLAVEKSPRDLARFLMVTIWGVRVLSATGADAATMRGVIRTALTLLDN